MSRSEFRRWLPFALAAASGFPLACAPNDWRTDMWYQPSLRPQDQPRPAPKDSVPVQGVIVADDRDDLEDLANPVMAEARALARGKVLFEERCSACHGMAGRGGGLVSKVFPPAPDLAFPTIVKRTDGFIFGTITLGGRAMPSLKEGLTVNERWEVVDWVRQIQKEASAADGGSP